MLPRRAGARYESEDHYVVLGVPRDADGASIKRAFRSESIRWHPDKPTANEARFLKVAAAYEVLSDDGKRRDFDDRLMRKERPPPPAAQPRQQRRQGTSIPLGGFNLHIRPGTVFHFTF